MIVVSNTSPLTNLAAIGQFDLFRHLYSSINIADGVWDELNARGNCWPGSKEVAGAAGWINRYSVKNQLLVDVLMRDVDRGEAESIALAIELEADLILLDEKEGRHAAQRLGLNVVGVVGMLLEAKKGGFVDNVRPHLDDLRHIAGFYLNKSIYRYVLGLAGETKA